MVIACCVSDWASATLRIQKPSKIDGISQNLSIFAQFDIFYANGHTEKQMIPLINYKEKTIAFMADLLPSTGHIPLPYVMGYDTRPLITIDEKKSFLDMAANKDFILFLEHDAYNECCSVKQTEKGVRLNNTFSLNEI